LVLDEEDETATEKVDDSEDLVSDVVRVDLGVGVGLSEVVVEEVLLVDLLCLFPFPSPSPLPFPESCVCEVVVVVEDDVEGGDCCWASESTDYSRHV
jgi:hypothetical protein